MRDHHLAIELLVIGRQLQEERPLRDDFRSFWLWRLYRRRQHVQWEFVFKRVNLRRHLGGFGTVERADHEFLRGPRRGNLVGAVFKMAFVIDVGKKCAERVKIFGCIWIVFMIVALAAPDGGSQPHTGYVANPIGLIDGPILFGLKPSFVRCLQEAVVGTCQNWIVCMFPVGRPNQVACQLQFCESVERNVVQKCLDHPVAIRRNTVVLIAVVANCVGVAN